MKMKDPEKYMIYENRQGFNENKINIELSNTLILRSPCKETGDQVKQREILWPPPCGPRNP